MIAQMKMGTLAVVLAIASIATATTARAEEQPCAESAGTLVRDTFTSAVESREPTDTLEALTAANTQIYYYTEIAGASGAHLTYQWFHDDELTVEIPFNVMADRWRSWSNKRVDQFNSGSWTVKVVGADGCVLSSHAIAYQ